MRAEAALDMAVDEGSPGRTRPLAALRHRNYRLYWTGQCVSVIGTWMQNVAQSWLVLELTNSAFLLGLVGVAQFAPILLFSLFGGVIADRLPRRRLIVLTQSAMMVLAFVLGILVLTGKVRYTHVVVLAALMGTLNAVDMPARQSFIIELVGRRDLMNGIALHSSLFNTARVVGPALAGLVIARFGLAVCFLVNAASYVAVLVQLLRLRLPAGRERPVGGGPVIEEIAAGLRYIRGAPDILLPILLLGMVSILAVNFNVLVPVFAREVLHRGAQGFGFLLAAHGLGALVGALTLAWLSHAGPSRKLVLGGILGLCVAQLALAAVRSYAAAVALLALAGWSMILFVGTVNTSVQLAADDRFRGRVMSVYTLVFIGVTPVGNFLAGSVAHLRGAPVAFAAGAALALLGTACAVLWRRAAKGGKRSATRKGGA
ncbi:MAG: MFS transporter [Bacillota bacterium]